MLELIATSRDGRTGMAQLSLDTIGTVSHAHVEFTPNDTDDDIESLTLHAPISSIEDLEIIFEDTCVPEHPFYIRYINHNGGYDYLMLEDRTWRTLSASGITIYSPFFAATPDARSTTRVINMEAKETVSAGLDRLSFEDATYYSRLIYSPKIEWFNPERQAWFEIVLDGNTANELDTTASTFTLEFTFRLPTPQIQM